MFQITNVQSFAQLGIEIEWRGKVRFPHPVVLNGAENEIGIVKSFKKEKLHSVIQPVSAPVHRSRLSDEGGQSNFDGDGSSNLSRRSGAETDHAVVHPSVSVGDTVIAVDPGYYRPTEVDLLIGDPSKAKTKLGWKAKTNLEELVKLMVESDFKKVLEKGY
ncbi:MAG: GDP-mannose 4,6-dehydratase [Melioribacteraceae bacterium]|nr:GDP-mannose 4,6-dehydratase [Saprospiraceae bacterium]MCF8355763.1 GDP-mannose 4,6-dehydratase [Melioribacteraceae bacterium]MCF8394791.1 GDP-mannose 4,6-dehydratase [Melioribacteraceae bacterium]